MRYYSILRPVSALALLLTLSGTFTLCQASLNSDLFIEPGKQFALGGGQPGAFKVTARNVGNVAVEFKERPRNGGIFGRTTLQPGQTATLRYLAGSTAVLLNGSGQTANVRLRITGDTNLRMDYEPTGQQ
ncbi:hypothetical protein [Hymenobacter chitinivorans]|uniref:Uncharacterized protein n=1 Tax=Hymenobacter chitinivorans DSM 11115 TaxID=1121954 RepID=A0A2M9BNY5_9BACT|nr:hypothetical protein [Hymenobacter chitinivorans]PJJ59665.1 hypothetical protein CLV45_1086 [Hymenobacter chitinivorans DSM 11115]